MSIYWLFTQPSLIFKYLVISFPYVIMDYCDVLFPVEWSCSDEWLTFTSWLSHLPKQYLSLLQYTGIYCRHYIQRQDSTHRLYSNLTFSNPPWCTLWSVEHIIKLYFCRVERSTLQQTWYKHNFPLTTGPKHTGRWQKSSKSPGRPECDSISWCDSVRWRATLL